MKKKIIRGFSIVLLFACFCQQFAFASQHSITTYNQYNPSDWAKEAVCSLEYYGIIQKEDIPNSDFYSMKGYRWNIRRDAIAYLMVNLYEFQIGTELPIPETYPLEKWRYNGFENSVKKAYGAALMKGRSDTDFGYTSITRQELAVVLYRAAKAMDCFKGDSEAFISNDEEKIADWALDAVSYVYYNGIMLETESGRFSPEDFVTKEMAYTCINRFAIAHGIYDKLPEDYISSIEFTPKTPVRGNIDSLYAAVNDQEKQVIQKALELFPNAFEIHAYAYTSDMEREALEDSDVYLPKGYEKYVYLDVRAEEGDFYLTITESGIYSYIKFSNEQYDQYKDLVFSIIDISRYKDIYLEKYENVREKAWDAEDQWYYDYEGPLDSDRIANGTWACISVDYDELYGGIGIEINDIYFG